MASPARIERLSPSSIFMVTFVASIALFVFSAISVIGLSSRQNEQLVSYELSLLLKGHGESLRTGQFRSFAESANFEGRPAKLTVDNAFDHSHFESSLGDLSITQQCAKTSYFQYDVSLCRPRLIPWSYLGLITLLYATITLLAFYSFIRANRAMIRSFANLFSTAGLAFPDNLTSSKAWHFAMNMAHRFKEFQAQSLEFSRNQIIAQLASQLAHDIRSPLSALNMVAASLEEVSDEKRDLIKAVSKRINDIANGLLQKRNLSSGLSTSPHEQAGSNSADLLTLVTSIVTEKRMQYVEYKQLEIISNNDNKESYLAKVNPVDVSRALSNIINNSVESLRHNKGNVFVSLHQHGGLNEIRIQDNGCGMSPEILSRLGTENFSFGKSGTASGSGLGFRQASDAISKFGGKLRVDSYLGQGTTVSISLPAEASM